jgi:probable HAF family extracellular repeat protein
MGYAINNAGVVVGTSNTVDGFAHPFASHQGQLIDIRPAGAPDVQGFQLDVASAVNTNGQITGWYNTTGDESNPVVTRAFVATPISLLLSQLLNTSRSLPYGVFLGATITVAERSYAAENLQATCAGIASFTYQVELYRYFHLITQNTGDALTADTAAIATALNCPGSQQPAVAATKVAAIQATRPSSKSTALAATTTAADCSRVARLPLTYCRAAPPLSRVATRASTEAK